MGRGVVLLIVCAVLLAAVIVTRPREDEPPEERSARRSPSQAELTFMPTRDPETAPVSEGRTVALGDTNVLLRYPEGFELAVDGAQLVQAQADGACGDGFEYCVYPQSRPPGVVAAGLGVSRRTDLDSEAACVLDPNAAFADSLPTVGGGGDHATATFGWVAGEVAGGRSATELRRLYFGGACFEFVTRVVAGSPELATALGSELTAIVAGVALPDGRTGLWSSGR